MNHPNIGGGLLLSIMHSSKAIYTHQVLISTPSWIYQMNGYSRMSSFKGDKFKISIPRVYELDSACLHCINDIQNSKDCWFKLWEEIWKIFTWITQLHHVIGDCK